MAIRTDSNLLGEQRQNGKFGDTGRYEGGRKLAEAGKYEEALAYMQEHFGDGAGDAQVLNDKGAILHCLGRSDEAIDCLFEARTVKSDSAEIVWNLAEAYLAAGRPSEAVRLFDDMDRMGILNVDILNRSAAILLDQNDKGDSLEALLRSLRIWPDQEVLRPMLDVIRSKRPKIAFFAGDDGTGFCDDIVEFIKQYFEVRLSDGRTDREPYELMEWSDVSWFDSCPDLAIKASKRTNVCRNVIGIHCYEGYEQWPRQVNWANIDTLFIAGNSIVKDALVRHVPGLETETSVAVVPCGVDLEKSTFIDRQCGKNIAFLPDLSPQRNPAFILQCMQKLRYIDPEYRLFFGGAFVDDIVEQYVRHMVEALDLGGVVLFDRRQEDVCSWLEDKHYIVSTSFFEGSSTGLLEAMACGLKPVVHNFPGANRIFPSEFLFDISEEFCKQICCAQYEPQRYRRFVEENYPLKKQLHEINWILNRIESRIEAQRADAVAGSCSPIRIREEIGLAAQSCVSALREG